jgi:hypothetical protein
MNDHSDDVHVCMLVRTSADKGSERTRECQQNLAKSPENLQKEALEKSSSTGSADYSPKSRDAAA